MLLFTTVNILFFNSKINKINRLNVDEQGGADAAIIVFDYTSKSSFEVLKYWLNQVEKYTKETKLVIVGNKIDLKDKREVTEDDIEQLITEYPGAILYKTSAKANILVEEVFNNTASNF